MQVTIFQSNMHINLISVSTNFDNLSVMLEEFQFPFSTMGSYETKIEKDNICLLNTNNLDIILYHNLLLVTRAA